MWYDSTVNGKRASRSQRLALDSNQQPTLVILPNTQVKLQMSDSPKHTSLLARARSLLIERIEEAISKGRISLHDDFQDEKTVEITGGELALLMQILFPEEYPEEPPRARTPTCTPPASSQRISVYRARAARGEDLFHPDDSCPIKDDRLALAGYIRRNMCARAMILGWR